MNTFDLGHVDESMTEAYQQYPWNKTIWYPRTNYSNSQLVQIYMTLMYQFIPGCIFDSILWMVRRDIR